MHFDHYWRAVQFVCAPQTRGAECYLYDMVRTMRHYSPFWAALWRLVRHDTPATYRMIARRIIVYFEQGFC